MPASDYVLLRRGAALASALVAGASVCCPLALAQDGSAVTDTQIEQARRRQPVITDDDIARAQRHRMPADPELHRVPVPAAPQIDALPAPAVSAPVDLEALAKGYEAEAGRMAAAQAMASSETLLIFVSFSMPQSTLQRLVDQASRAGAAVVVRGFVNGSLPATIARVQALVGRRNVAFQIDPQAFERFAVRTTPTFVLARPDAPGLPCNAGRCLAADAFAAATGDVSLDYALDFIARGAPSFARAAHAYRKKLGG